MTAAFYDFRAGRIVNEAASEAIDFVNRLCREQARPSFDLAEICFWSAQAVAPEAGLAKQLEIGRLAQAQVRDVMARLQHAVAA